MKSLTYWKMERDADALVWLALDKPGTSTNVLSGEVLVELGALVDELAANVPRALIISSAKRERVHCRRRYQRVHLVQGDRRMRML